MPNIEPLGMLVGRHLTEQGQVIHGMRANDKKRGKIGAFPVPKCGEEVEAFLYLTTYLKTLIPGRTELARVMKEAVVWSQDEGKGKKVAVGFEWSEEQQNAFDQIQEAIQNNVVVGGDVQRKYYLSVVAARCGFGAVLFQLLTEDEEKLEKTGKSFPKGKERVVQFISTAFLDAESRYPVID